MNNNFISNAGVFNNECGYIVTQSVNGKIICEQFIPSTAYADFCKEVKVIPILDIQELH